MKQLSASESSRSNCRDVSKRTMQNVQCKIWEKGKHFPLSIFRFVLALYICVSLVLMVSAQRQGSGWIWLNPIPQGNQLNAIHFAKDKLIGVAVGSDSTIVRTTDGGFTWQRFTSPVDSTLTGVFVKDKKHTVIVGTRGTIMTLVDGQFWQAVPVSTKEHLYGLTFTGSMSNVGWAVGSHGTILKTADGGATWAGQNSGSTE